MELDDLYAVADKHDISVYSFRLPVDKSLSVMQPDLSCHVAIDSGQFVTQAEEKVALAHELGHCLTGSFYNRYSPCDVRGRHESRANRKAVLTLVPPDELLEACKDPWNSIYDLSERFGITEEFMRYALEYYDTELKRVFVFEDM